MYSVKDYKPSTGSGKVLGYFTLVVDDMEINSFSLVDGGKGMFVGFPQRSYTDNEGTTKYTGIVWMPDQERRNAFQKWVLPELDKIRNVEQKQDVESDDIPF